MQKGKATLGAGCFWGIQEIFHHVAGVISTRAGYMGGRTERPTYEDVCKGDTGHLEVVEVTFDPGEVSYTKLLELFWRMHDPTSTDNQGGFEIGSQYGAAIFYHTAEQKCEAEKSKDVRSGLFAEKIVTIIRPVVEFWTAEDYHQDYIRKGGKHHCHVFTRGFQVGKEPE